MLTRYIECTSSTIQALVLFKKLHPQHRRKEIEGFLTRASEYLEKMQMQDGSWFVLIYVSAFYTKTRLQNNQELIFLSFC